MKLERVLRAIDLLDGDVANDVEWVSLPNNRKMAVEGYVYDEDYYSTDDDPFTLDNFDNKKLWNLADPKLKTRIATIDTESISLVLNKIASKLHLYCRDVLESLGEHIKKATETGEDPRTMDLLRFYGTFYDVSIPRSSRQSEAAVGDRNDCSSSVVGSTLKADQIHHNMFRDENNELSFQRFKRIAMGGVERARTDDLGSLITAFGLQEQGQSLMEFFPEALTNLKNARSFLMRFGAPLEPLTQSVFYAFLTDLLTKLNAAFESSNAYAQVVAGMTPIELQVSVSASYMRLNAKKRGVKTYQGGAKKTVLKIMSDVVIYEGYPSEHEEETAASQQQKHFLDCRVNVEMKKWGLLSNRLNKSPITQVAAESMARRLKLKERCPDGLFSLLTDCMVLYGVYHDVPGNTYWISRSENTAEEILVSICWLYLSSIRVVSVNNIADWEWIDEDDGDGAQGEEQSSLLDSVDESGETDDCHHEDTNERRSGRREVSGQAFSEMDLPAVSFEDDEEAEEEDRQRLEWQTFFLMENHRKFGTRLPLTDRLVELHNAKQQ